MPLSAYYRLLGLPNTATVEQVRKQYRKLAMQYHPDKNHSQQASELFIRITEAYEILTGRKEAPRTTLNKTEVRKSNQEERMDRIREARKRQLEQRERERLRDEQYFQQLFVGIKWRIIRACAVVGTVIAILLLLELLLPGHYDKDEITHYYKDLSERSSTTLILKAKHYGDVYLDNVDYTLTGNYTKVYLQRSWIFHLPEKLISVRKTEYVYFDIVFTFHQVRFLLILVFLLPWVVVKFRRQVPIYTMAYLISLYVSPVALVIFLLSANNWAHLLTLGFL